jgi:hypothetical protein
MNPTQPDKRLWLIVLILLWAMYGLAGRDAWKPEEALTLAQILDWQDQRQSVWLSTAPLYTAVAGSLIGLLSMLMDAQDAARQASGLFVLLSMMFIGMASRAMFGRGFGSAAALAMLGSFGLMLLAHAMMPETALLATWAMLLCGVALARKRSDQAAALIGIALTLCLLGLRGLPDLLAALLVLLLPLSFRAWRDRAYLNALVPGLVLATVLIVAGLAWIGWQGQLAGWWAGHGWPQGLRAHNRIFADLAWAAWPLWPLALAGVWHVHRRLARTSELQPILIALLVSLLQSLLPTWSRDGGLLPVLVPLAMLAAFGLEDLRRGAAQWLYWFGVLCFLFFALAFWVYFAAIEWGWPVKLAAHMARLTPGYARGSVTSGAILLAALATLLWLIAIPLFPRAKIRPVLVWATGMTLIWVLVVALYRPWVEQGWGYRPLLLDMARHLPAGECVRAEVDAATRVMLRYHLGYSGRGKCNYVLRQYSTRVGRVGSEQVVVWQSAKPRVRHQVYRLEHRGRQ